MLEIFFPKTCSVCKSVTDKPLCNKCIDDLRCLDKVDCCSSCGEPFNHIDNDSKSTELCLRCIKNEFYFKHAKSVFIHKGIIKDLLHRFKYRKKIILAGVLSELIISKFPYDSAKFDTVIPVPLHIKKLREREYNQSSLLAKRIAKHLDCKFDPFSLAKIKQSKPQFEMGNLSERIKNVKDAFSVENVKYMNIKGKSVLLVDDVYTTGSTINECSKVLLEAGAERIDVLTLTRATY